MATPSIIIPASAYASDIVFNVNFEVERTSGVGTDWGGGSAGQYCAAWVNVANSADRGYSSMLPIPGPRTRLSVRWQFALPAGKSVEVWGAITCGYGYVVTAYNTELVAERIFR